MFKLREIYFCKILKTGNRLIYTLNILRVKTHRQNVKFDFNVFSVANIK